MATDMIARALAAKAMREAAGGGAEQFLVTVTDRKSDKTPAEIAAAAKAGKQVILKNSSGPVEQFCYLVNAENNVATFCGTVQVVRETADAAPIFARGWAYILNDQTLTYGTDFNLPFFTIEKDANGKYTSDLSPELLLSAAYSGCAGNVFFVQDDGSMLFGTFNSDSEDALHIYFPDYAKNKVYDFKYNDDDPATYTFTELSLGGGGGELFKVNITRDVSAGKDVADKTYAEIAAAIESGKNVRCEYGGYQSSYYTYVNDDIDFICQMVLSGKERRISSTMIVIHITSKDEISTSVVYSPLLMGFPDIRANSILVTDKNGEMFYRDADEYLVKQPTTGESGLFLSNNGTGGSQEWANPLTLGDSDSVVIKSSTPNSSKKFRITVDDAGAITATEVV